MGAEAGQDGVRRAGGSLWWTGVDGGEATASGARESVGEWAARRGRSHGRNLRVRPEIPMVEEEKKQQKKKTDKRTPPVNE